MAYGLESGAQLASRDDAFEPGEELEFLARLPLADDLDGFVERPNDVARGPHARVVDGRMARSQDVDELGGSRIEVLAEAAHDRGAQTCGFVFEGYRKAAASRGKAVENVEAVGARE